MGKIWKYAGLKPTMVSSMGVPFNQSIFQGSLQGPDGDGTAGRDMVVASGSQMPAVWKNGAEVATLVGPFFSMHNQEPTAKRRILAKNSRVIKSD